MEIIRDTVPILYDVLSLYTVLAYKYMDKLVTHLIPHELTSFKPAGIFTVYRFN